MFDGLSMRIQMWIFRVHIICYVSIITLQGIPVVIPMDRHCERITYEKLKRGFDDRTVVRQPLLVPETVSVAENEADLVESSQSLLEDIGLVVNYEFPYEAEDYVHRIGRTGRAGVAGTAISFACEDESFIIPDIEEWAWEGVFPKHLVREMGDLHLLGASFTENVVELPSGNFTSHLASLRSDMRDEIRRLQREFSISTVHITHDQEEALSMADRVAVMEAGRLIQIATPLELYDRPATRSVANFVGEANLWDGVVASEDSVQLPFGLLLTERHGYSPGKQVTVLVRPENITVGQAGEPVNLFKGQIVRDRFLGAVRRYDLSVEDSVILGQTGIRGRIDAVSIRPEHVRLLPA